MNLKQFQATTTALAAIAWPDEMKDPGRMDAKLGDKLAEEMGELAKACRRHSTFRTHWRMAARVTDDDVMDEVGDVLFVLARRGALHGIDLNAAAQRAIGKFANRLVGLGHDPDQINAMLNLLADQFAESASPGNIKIPFSMVRPVMIEKRVPAPIGPVCRLCGHPDLPNEKLEMVPRTDGMAEEYEHPSCRF